MSNQVNEMLDGQAIFQPSEEKKTNSKPDFVPTVEGDYYGHISKVTTRIVNFQNYRARVYNFFLTVDEHNKCNTYEYKWDNETRTTNGGAYVGKQIIAKGIFKFLEPKEGDTFVSNSKENERYFRFCESIGIKPEVKDIDGAKVKVLPEISEADIEGRPAIGFVKEGKPWVNKEGKTCKGWEVKFVKEWKDGVKKTNTSSMAQKSTNQNEVSDDDLPF
jgi:hypothetical protein